MSEADKKIQFEVAADGTAEVAQAFDKVAASMERQLKTQKLIADTSKDLKRAQVIGEIQKEADAWARLDSTQKMLAQTSAQIQRSNVIEQLKKEAAAVNAETDALVKNKSAWEKVSSSSTALFTSTDKLKAASGQTAALVGNLSQSLSQLAPSTSGVTTALRGAGSAMSQMLGILGTAGGAALSGASAGGAAGGAAAGSAGGPAGMLIGAGLVAAVSGLGSYMASAKEEADALAEATKKNTGALADYVGAIANLRSQASGKVGALQSEGDLGTRLANGTATDQEFNADLAARRHRLAERFTAPQLNRIRNRPESAGGGETGVQAALAEYARLTKVLDETESAYSRVMSRRAQDAAAKLEGDKKTKDAQGDIGQAEADEAARLAGIEDYTKAHKWSTPESLETTQGKMKQIDALIAASKKKVTDKESEAEAKESDIKMIRMKAIHDLNEYFAEEDEVTRKRADEAEKERLDKYYAALQTKHKAYTDAVTNVAQIGASTSVKLFSEMAKGHEIALGSVIEGIGDQMVAEGTRVLFQAAAMAFFPPTAPFAAGLAGVGAAEIAAGLALGAAGARASGGSSAGASGGGGGGEPARTNYADPFGDTARYGSTATGPMIININFPTMLSPSAVDGARIQQATRQAMRVYG